MQVRLLSNLRDPTLTLVSDPTAIVRERLRSLVSRIGNFSANMIRIYLYKVLCGAFFQESDRSPGSEYEIDWN